MPLGSLAELLTPPMLPGPWGIPLTPASPARCARDLLGAIKLATNARAKNADLPNIDHTPAKRVQRTDRLAVPHLDFGSQTKSRWGRDVLAGGKTLPITLSDAANPDSAPTIAAPDEFFLRNDPGH